MLCEGEVSLPRGWAQPANRSDGRFGQLKARIGVIETEEINAVMRSRELTVGIKEQWIVRNSLIEQSNGFEQIVFFPRAKRNAVDQVFGPQICVVGDKIRSRRLLDGGFFGGGDINSEPICDFLGDLRLESKHIIDIPIVFLRPKA